MNELKLFLEQTNQSWTLKPNREYIVGSGSDCNIALPHANFVSDKHLKFSFDQFSNTWHVCDLGSSTGTFVDSQQITDYPIRYQTRIAIGGGLILVATPEAAAVTPAPVPPPIYAPTPQPPSAVPPTRLTPSPTSRNSAPIAQPSQLEVLTWKQYVDKQVAKQSNWFSRLATRFYMITGFRNTPWVRAYRQTGFNAFDGYIIPDFKESAETVAAGIEGKLEQMRGYGNTDCFVAKLTDAHIADSATQSFLGVELFPIQRAGRADYRRFGVVSYHRVRTYLLVENYGSDLFVSWVTRFEPDPTPVVPALWLALAFLCSFIGIGVTIETGNSGQQILLAILPLSLWFIIYLAPPRVMESLSILPKKANARLIVFLLLILSVLWFIFWPLMLFFFVEPYSGSKK